MGRKESETFPLGEGFGDKPLTERIEGKGEIEEKKVVVVPLSRGGTLCVNNIKMWGKIVNQWGSPREACFAPIPGRPLANYGLTLLNGLDIESQREMFRIFAEWIRSICPESSQSKSDLFTLLATPANRLSLAWVDFQNLMRELSSPIEKTQVVERIFEMIPPSPGSLSLADAFALWDQGVMKFLFPDSNFVVGLPSFTAAEMKPEWQGVYSGANLLYRIIPEAFVNAAGKRAIEKNMIGVQIMRLLSNKRWRGLKEKLGVLEMEGGEEEWAEFLPFLPEGKKRVISRLLSAATPSCLLRGICDEYLSSSGEDPKIPVYRGSEVLSFLFKRAGGEDDCVIIQQSGLRPNTLSRVGVDLMIGIPTIIAPREDEKIRDYSIFLEI